MSNPIRENRDEGRRDRRSRIGCNVGLADCFARQPTQDFIETLRERSAVPLLAWNEFHEGCERRAGCCLNVSFPRKKSRELGFLAYRSFDLSA